MKKVVTVCPYCASGCKINLVVDNGKIVRAEAAQGKTLRARLDRAAEAMRALYDSMNRAAPPLGFH